MNRLEKETREDGVPQLQLGHCQCPHPMRPCAMPSTTPRMRTSSPDTLASPSSTPPLATTSPNSVKLDSIAPLPEGYGHPNYSESVQNWPQTDHG